MTSTSTPRAGLSRLLNNLAALAFLLVVAGGASAQSGAIIYVDSDGGSDARDGQQPNVTGTSGPVATIGRALEIARNRAGDGETISFDAGTYDASGVTIANATGSTSLSNLTFMARTSQSANARVVLNVGGGTFQTAVPGFTFASQGGDGFVISGGGTVDFQAGSVNFGTGAVTFDGIDTVERTNAAVTGTVTYASLPSTLRFNGDGNVSAGTLLPGTVDAATGTVLIDVALGSQAATVNDNARTFTLGTGGLTLGDDGGSVTLRVRDGNQVFGTVTTVDGTGANGTADVIIEGEGSIGDLVVNGASTQYNILEGDALNTADTNNAAASITVSAGTLDFNSGAGRYLVTGDFRQTGGTVTGGTGVILVVQGDFRQTRGATGDIVFDPINVYLEGSDDADFAPIPDLTLNSLHINATPEPSTGVPASSKTVLFLEDITVSSAAGGTSSAFIVTNDAEVDLNGNTVNVTNGGTSIVNGTVSDSGNSGAVRFVNGGTVSGTAAQNAPAAYSSIIVDGGNVAVDGNFTYTGALILFGGGLTVNAGSDISPAGNQASVVVNIAAANDPSIMGAGTFNADDVDYDLTYQDTDNTATAQAFTVGSEFATNDIRNLLVQVSNATIDATSAADGTISGNVIVRNGDVASTTGASENATLTFGGAAIVVSGFTQVDDNAVLTLSDAAGSYAVSTANNVLDGVIDGSGDLVLRNGAVITGGQTTTTGTTAATTEARIDAPIVLANGATASLLQLRAISGDISDAATTAANAGTLTIGLVADNENIANAPFNPETAGDITGGLDLSNSTLVLASAVDVSGTGIVRVSTLNTGEGNYTFFVDGATGLELLNSVIGTGSVWPASDDIVINGTSHNAITIPTFHPGDQVADNVEIGGNITVTNLIRITGVVDAEAQDGMGTGTAAQTDYAVTIADGATLVVDEGYMITRDAGAGDVEPSNTPDRELVIAGTLNFTTNEVGVVDSFSEFVLNTQNVLTFTVENAAALTPGNASYRVRDFVVTAATGSGDTAGRFDLAGNDFAASGNVTFRNNSPLNNSVGDGDRSTANYSRFSFVGSDSTSLTLTGRTYVADGIDIAIDKDDAQDAVTVVSAAPAGSTVIPGLLFDDEFDVADTDGSGGVTADDNDDTANDEYLVLNTGILVVGDPTRPNGVFIRLDHENSITEGGIATTSTSDEGQGFAFAPDMSTQFPQSYVAGNVRKRIQSVASSTVAGRQTPGRVVYPVGDEAGNYAEYVLDFESIEQDQSFSRRDVTVSFAAQNPGGQLGLPVTDEDGDTYGDTGNFFWLVTSDPTLGSGTRFNVEARYDGFELRTGTNDGNDETIGDLVLIRRQFGDATQNPFTLVSNDNDSFVIEGPDGDNNPLVTARGAVALLGPQGTLFTYGLRAENRPVDGETGPTVLPTVLALKGNAPNPFRGQTTLAFDLPQASEVTVAVFDVMGRQVMTLNKGTMAPGEDRTVEIDGSSLASGVYVFRLTAVGADGKPETKAGQITLAR